MAAKKPSLKTFFVFTSTLFTFCSVSFSYDFAGGTGEPNDPYQIETAEQLLQIGSDANLLDKCFILNNDIDLDPDVTGIPPFTQAPIAPDIGASPGFQVTPFTGIFDGNANKINNLIIDTAGANGDFLGIFGLISGEQAQVRNLGIENVSVIGGNKCNYLGGLCGRNYGNISNCYSTGSIWGGNSSNFVGGLIGYNCDESISNCYSICTISGYKEIGGLCGYNSAGSISNCYAASSIDGEDYLGGLCGYNDNGSVTNCYAAGIVNSNDSYYIGGLCGRKTYYGSISNGYFYMYSGPDNGLGTVLEESQPGKECFVGFDFAGDPNDGTDDYWTIVSGHCPKLTWQTNDGPLIPAPPATTLSGSGYPDDPFLINSESDFIEFYSNNNLISGYYTLTTDVDLSGQTFNTAVINRPFGGHFEGNSNIISNLTIDTNGVSINYLGLFRRIRGASAEVNNLGIIDCNITGGGESSYVGGLCGSNFYSSSINNCYSTGSVSGFSYVGGLIGRGSTISNSFSKCTVSGQTYIGGFCGDSGGGIDSCYATGTVLGSDNADSIGGFCGRNVYTTSNCYAKGDVSSGNDSSNIGGFCGKNTTTFTITHCYSTGFVSAGDNSSDIGGLCGDNTYGTVINSYWDVNTSGQESSHGGTGKTTTEMKTLITFIDAGWDFNDIWAICEGTNYPRLLWQILPADFLCPDGVDFLDYTHFSYCWLDENCALLNDCEGADFDLSGCVDGNDLKSFTESWLEE